MSIKINHNDKRRLASSLVLILSIISITACSQLNSQTDGQERIQISALPLPPTAPSPEIGSCTLAVNPNGTGCLDASRRGVDGVRTFSPDGNHVYVSVHFSGAPESPNPASIYSGGQLLLVKTDGTTFPNGDGWKCITCNVPDENKVGINNPDDNTYPEAFTDGMRLKMGNNILDCSPYKITDLKCSGDSVNIYPIKSPFPAGPSGGIMRELRLHPDNVHLGWNQLFFSKDFTSANQFGVFGRLIFNSEPADGVPGYELKNVYFLLNKKLGFSGRFIGLNDAGELMVNEPAGVIGEFRGFTPDGKNTLGIGTQDSFNYDIFSTSLETGKSKRLTWDPAYVDPVNITLDGKWMVVMDGRVTSETGYPGANPAGSDGRLYFAGAGIGVPPLIDLAIAESIAALYTDESRGSFLQPYLINLQAEDFEKNNGTNNSSIHQGRQINAGEDPTAGSGSLSDPLWLGGASPAWSPDGTAIVYYQRRGCNKGTVCPPTKEPGGRLSRLLIARLVDREPITEFKTVEPVDDVVGWGIPYNIGDPLPPERKSIPEGSYTLRGKQGFAEVVITTSPSRFNENSYEVDSVKVHYHSYSVDGKNIINGIEHGVRKSVPYVSNSFTWFSDLQFTGEHNGSRKSSDDGFTVTYGRLGSTPQYSGVLTTTLDGMVYTSPTN